MDIVAIPLLIIASVLAVAVLALGVRRRRASAIALGVSSSVLTGLAILLFLALGYAGLLVLTAGAISLVLGIVGLPLALRRRNSPGQRTAHAGQTNGLALAAIIVVWFSSVVGLILGHVALGQISRGEGVGRELALTAVIVGWISTALAVLAAIGLLLAGIASSQMS